MPLAKAKKKKTKKIMGKSSSSSKKESSKESTKSSSRSDDIQSLLSRAQETVDRAKATLSKSKSSAPAKTDYSKMSAQELLVAAKDAVSRAKRPVPAPVVDDMVQNNPFLAQQFQDPRLKAQFDALPDDLKGIYLQSANALQKAIESGQVINPNIELTAKENRKLLAQAEKELDPYYREQLGLLRDDFETSIDRLMGDYETVVDRQEEQLPIDLKEQADAEAEAGVAFSSGRKDRLDRKLQLENQGLQDLMDALTRSASDAGSAYEREAGTDALRKLNIPGLDTFRATERGIERAGSRSLLRSGGTKVKLGNINKEREAAVSNRKSQLESSYRARRLLDLRGLSY